MSGSSPLWVAYNTACAFGGAGWLAAAGDCPPHVELGTAQVRLPSAPRCANTERENERGRRPLPRTTALTDCQHRDGALCLSERQYHG